MHKSSSSTDMGSASPKNNSRTPNPNTAENPARGSAGGNSPDNK
jgi:hypothetical protein